MTRYAVSLSVIEMAVRWRPNGILFIMSRALSTGRAGYTIPRTHHASTDGWHEKRFVKRCWYTAFLDVGLP